MLDVLLNVLGWWVFVALLIVTIVLYARASRRITLLEQQVRALTAAQEAQQRRQPVAPSPAPQTQTPAQTPPPLSNDTSNAPAEHPMAQQPNGYPQFVSIAPVAITVPFVSAAAFYQTLYGHINPRKNTRTSINNQQSTHATPQYNSTNTMPPSSPSEPDERSLPMVTSLASSIKNWFFGGNLVVRVGVIVLLVGVVLLLRLISDYIEIPITLKLGGIALAGLGLAGLGYRLTDKRFTYGITLQGAGLAITYLTVFFAYWVYQVLGNSVSFTLLALLAISTTLLAVRQNAFPLAVLALSGGFFAPLLTGTDSGSLSLLFGYYLLLNTAVALMAHYRAWKVLNLVSVLASFGVAYYLGLTESISVAAQIDEQRWILVLLTALHVLLYLFVAIRYAQHIIAYNNNTAISPASAPADNARSIFPIDTSLLFSVPVLAFGIFAVLLEPIDDGLTMTAGVLALMYLGVGYVFAKKSPRYLLITESMLALGAGFLALMLVLALDADWTTGGWSIQALALVWLGQRSQRIWAVYFGLWLHILSVFWLWFWDIPGQLYAGDGSLVLVWLITAWLPLISAFILREHAQPQMPKDHTSNEKTASTDWASRVQLYAFTLVATGWSVWATYAAFDLWWSVKETTLFALALILHSAVYWLIDSKASWHYARKITHLLFLALYALLLTLHPVHIAFDYSWSDSNWLLFIGSMLAAISIALLWLKRWYQTGEQRTWDATGLLITVLAVIFYSLLLRSDMATAHIAPPMLLVTLLYGIPLYGYYRQMSAPANARTPSLISRAPAWMGLPHALIGAGNALLPFGFVWVIFSNLFEDGKVWGLPYLPVLSIVDITMAAIMGCSLLLLMVLKRIRAPHASLIEYHRHAFLALAVIGFFWLSSILVRTLHAFAGTPLWLQQHPTVWQSEQVQTGLTILWTLIALAATFIANRYRQRLLWFGGIGLLGVVLLKLMFIDLSQTKALLRVASFIVAGSLILLIGYLAPLPPAADEHKADA